MSDCALLRLATASFDDIELVIVLLDCYNNCDWIGFNAMFKKDLPPQKLNLLKNKEIKALKKEVGIQFPLLQKEDVDSFFNSFQGLISVSKLETRTLLYYVNNIPYLFDVEGRNKLFPTIHFLFIFPHTLRSIYIHSPVSEWANLLNIVVYDIKTCIFRYILRGADLFSPGIATYEGNYEDNWLLEYSLNLQIP